MRRLTLLLALCLTGLSLTASPASAISWGSFNAKVTKGLGAEVTLHTRRALAAEAQAEGGNARYNLYNTTLRLPGSTNYNSVGVQNYVSAAQGIEATIRTLKEQGHGYEKIRKRLRANAPAGKIVRGFGESEWGTNLALVLAVLEDIRHNRAPNTLGQLERKQVSS